MIALILLALLVVCLPHGSADPPRCNFLKDQDYKDAVAGMVHNYGNEYFQAGGKNVPDGSYNFQKPITASTFDHGICFGPHMASVFPNYGKQGMNADVCPIQPSAFPNSFQFCNVKNINVKLQIQETPIAFKNCKFDLRKTETEQVEKKLELHGELKLTPEILKAAGLEVSGGFSHETTRTYTVSTEEFCKSGQSGTLTSLALIASITFGEIAVAGKTLVAGTTSQYECDPNKFVLKDFKNTYIVDERLNWLACSAEVAKSPAAKRAVAKRAVAKRDLELYPDERLCYGLDMVQEPCLD